jgi:hypothetical protein
MGRPRRQGPATERQIGLPSACFLGSINPDCIPGLKKPSFALHRECTVACRLRACDASD